MTKIFFVSNMIIDVYAIFFYIPLINILPKINNLDLFSYSVIEA